MSIMLREIEEQPAALQRTLEREWRKVQRFRQLCAQRQFRLVILVARGTSDNAAMFGRYLIEITTGIPVSLSAPSVHTLYGRDLEVKDALVVGISQSGEGSDINMVLDSSRKRGACTLGITNEPKSSMVNFVDECWFVHAGKERSVAATKTYTGQLLMLYLLSWALGGRLDENQFHRIPDYAATALKLRDEVAGLVERYCFIRHAVVVGRGLNYANAYELALKLMETCYVVAERFSSADFLHGPIAMVERNFPVFVFAPPGATEKGINEILRKVLDLGAETLTISSRPLDKLARRQLQIPLHIDELYTPIPYIVPGQMVAAMLATVRGIDPDAPRLLTKVTKTV